MGAGLSQFTPEQIKRIKQETRFTEEDMVQHLKRYAKYDTSEEGTDGIPLETLRNFPEFVGNPFIDKILMLYIDKQRQVIYAENFLYLCGILSPKADTRTKRELAFRLFDVHNMGYLQYEEVFKMYKMIFPPGSLTDDQILDMVFRALNIQDLQQPAKVTYDDFREVVSDGEIRNRFTTEVQVQ